MDLVVVYLKNLFKYELKNVKYLMINNCMVLEFGFFLEVFCFRKKKIVVIIEYLDQLDSEMDFILVVEKLEELMVLFRWILNWKL